MKYYKYVDDVVTHLGDYVELTDSTVTMPDDASVRPSATSAVAKLKAVVSAGDESRTYYFWLTANDAT